MLLYTVAKANQNEALLWKVVVLHLHCFRNLDSEDWSRFSPLENFIERMGLANLSLLVQQVYPCILRKLSHRKNPKISAPI